MLSVLATIPPVTDTGRRDLLWTDIIFGISDFLYQCNNIGSIRIVCSFLKRTQNQRNNALIIFMFFLSNCDILIHPIPTSFSLLIFIVFPPENCQLQLHCCGNQALWHNYHQKSKPSEVTQGFRYNLGAISHRLLDIPMQKIRTHKTGIVKKSAVC